MRCPKCGNFEDKVMNVRSKEHETIIRRRRECLNCKNRWTTYELSAETLKNNQTEDIISKYLGDDA